MKKLKKIGLAAGLGLALAGSAVAGGTPSQFLGYGTFDQYQFNEKPCTAFGQPSGSQINIVQSGSINGIVQAYGFDEYDEYSSTDPWGFSMWATMWIYNQQTSPVPIQVDTYSGPLCTESGCLANGNCANATWTGCTHSQKPNVTIAAGATTQINVQTFDDAQTDNQYGNAYVTFKPIGAAVTCKEVDWGQAGNDQVPGNF